MLGFSAQCTQGWSVHFKGAGEGASPIHRWGTNTRFPVLIVQLKLPPRFPIHDSLSHSSSVDRHKSHWWQYAPCARAGTDERGLVQRTAAVPLVQPSPLRMDTVTEVTSLYNRRPELPP